VRVFSTYQMISDMKERERDVEMALLLNWPAEVEGKTEEECLETNNHFSWNWFIADKYRIPYKQDEPRVFSIKRFAEHNDIEAIEEIPDWAFELEGMDVKDIFLKTNYQLIPDWVVRKEDYEPFRKGKENRNRLVLTDEIKEVRKGGVEMLTEKLRVPTDELLREVARYVEEEVRNEIYEALEDKLRDQNVLRDMAEYLGDKFLRSDSLKDLVENRVEELEEKAIEAVSEELEDSDEFFDNLKDLLIEEFERSEL